ncbi:MAG TPA: phage tail sheath subtilisin-like domain-containing protein [Terriglobales bacterium]|nr:phage tail sheath subtilisin-like domain-containing protein [Terriglobales bacterium]
MERLHPGVYIEEVSSGVRPIEGVSTSNGAFIGKAEMGPLGEARLVTSLAEFQAAYGGFLTDSYLAHGVFQFFNNGGKKTYIVRVAGAGARAASITLRDRKIPAASQTLEIDAINEGGWGNMLGLVISNTPADPANAFNMQVIRFRDNQNPPLPPQVLETFAGLVMDPNSPNFVNSVVSARSRYITATADTANLNTAAAGTSRSGQLPIGDGAAAMKLGAANGGTEAAGGAGTAGSSVSAATPDQNPPADQRAFTINLDSDGAQQVVIPPDADTGPKVAAAIQTAVRSMTANNAARQAAYNGFTCTFPGTNLYTLTSGTQGASSSVVVTAAQALGGGTATPISLAGPVSNFMITINGDGPHLVTLNGALANGTAIAGAIQTAVRAVVPSRSANAAAFSGFTAAYENNNAGTSPSLLLTSGAAGTSASVVVTNALTNNVAGTLQLGASNLGSEITGAAALRPANSAQPNTEYRLGTASVSGNVAAVVIGQDGTTPGDLEHKNGLNALDTVRDVNIVCIPGISSADVVSTGVNYCAQRGDCFFIGDPHPTDDTVDEARAFVNSLTVKSSYGACYYPWLEMADPTGASTAPINVPPSGFVAGMYAKIDSTRGVWKAPAGTEANLAGAVGLLADTTDAQQDFLNPIGVNVIRSFPASGIVIWGARTLATLSNPEYRYVPVRRTAMFLEQSIYNGIQYAVFEPNDFGLWASLRLNIGAFMMQQFRAGAFQGKTPNDAFFVKVDETTTTQQDIDAGTVNILVGFAPLKPAEFVVLQLTQKAGQPAV